MVVAERYRLEEILGRGGMGSVWRARHLSLDTPCAIKFIDGEAGDAAELRVRFEREAKAAAQLRSPNVVQVLDHGVWSGTPYLVMELLDGEDLATRLARAGHLSPAETIAIARDVARALGRAHAAGIVHRDLKPENIFLVNDGDREIAKVLDFGIAKVHQTEALGGPKTRTGSLIGTPHYMSPEQADGTRKVDHRSDVWSLGVIVIECLSGRKPFDSDALGDLLMRIMSRPIPTVADLGVSAGDGLEAWWARASARTAESRFQSAQELVTALVAALPDAGAAEAPTSTAVASRRVVVTPRGATDPGLVDARTLASTTDPSLADARTISVSGSPRTLAGQTTQAEARSTGRRTGAVVAAATLLVGVAAFAGVKWTARDAAPATTTTTEAGTSSPGRSGDGPLDGVRPPTLTVSPAGGPTTSAAAAPGPAPTTSAGAAPSAAPPAGPAGPRAMARPTASATSKARPDFGF